MLREDVTLEKCSEMSIKLVLDNEKGLGKGA